MSVRLGVGAGPFYASSSPTGCLGLLGALIALPFLAVYWILKLVFKIGAGLYKALASVVKSGYRKWKARRA